jgi:hypothetical protein
MDAGTSVCVPDRNMCDLQADAESNSIATALGGDAESNSDSLAVSTAIHGDAESDAESNSDAFAVHGDATADSVSTADALAIDGKAKVRASGFSLALVTCWRTSHVSLDICF